ncbi:hypothetical protein [Opitutus sp. GAS368]|uniref:hypothetical protein n=1 Tax=Opitutus sp. GAS368 TaxID=1882749 RepID=UPI00087AFF32|nr:hypothetical protein [Opitutus sp. GAS368]SDS46768.1 hypothetical protein SAMN05444173_2977 [Opitutus sp. GAS368]
MAKVEINAITSHFQGKLGDIRFRNYLGRKIVVLRRKPSSAPPTAAQQQVYERFLLGAAYAKGALGNPATRAVYAERSKLRQHPVFAVAVSDYLLPPEVKVIDTTDYHGRIGDPVKVTAIDDFEVVGVNVVIRDDTAAVLEQGPAVLVGEKWVYTATVAVPAGEMVTIEATAKDRPGHTGSLSQPWLIA